MILQNNKLIVILFDSVSIKIIYSFHWTKKFKSHTVEFSISL